MNLKLTLKNQNDRRAFVALTLFVMVFVLVTLAQDFIRASFHHTAFYFSEAFLFSSFWWIFVPFLYAQYYLVKTQNSANLWFQVFLVFMPFLLHILAFPILVWAISSLFYFHTYAIQQTLKYTLSEHLYPLILLYAIPVPVYQSVKKGLSKPIIGAIQTNINEQFITSLLITEGNKYMSIAIADILYFSANAPYINVHLNGKEYLHNATLKSISESINNEQFIRIHKSSIVNIEHAKFYTSRLNGDYDLTMVNGAKLRVSRNYAPRFKEKFKESHRLGIQ